MLQAIGLTSRPGRSGLSAVRDLSFEAPEGRITALFGPTGAGKSTALRLMLELEPGRGTTYFRGNPLHRVARPAREVGALLGDVPGHPARTARGQLRMLCAAAGVALVRADELLDEVGLSALGDQRLDALSLAADRRLGIAAALLPAPQTLLLDEPGKGLTPREHVWQYGLMRAHADRGGTVLWTTDDPKGAAVIADRVVTVGQGRLIADQAAAVFARTRLRPRVTVCTPYAVRLASLLQREARAALRSVEVVVEGGGELSIYGSNCAEVGEIAYRHRVLVYRLAEETGESVLSRSEGGTQGERGDRVSLTRLPPGTTPDPLRPIRRSIEHPERGGGGDQTRDVVPDVASAHGDVRSLHSMPPPVAPGRGSASSSDLLPDLLPTPPTPVGRSRGGCRPVESDRGVRPPPALGRGTHPTTTGTGQRVLASTEADRPPHRPPGSASRPSRQSPRRPLVSPLRPVRYELLRLFGVRTTTFVLGAALLVSPVLCLLLARSPDVPVPVAIAAWPDFLPLPPAALCAGLIGALSYGEEFRHPVLAARGTVPRRLALLLAKLLVTGVGAVVIALLVAGIDVQLLGVVYGPEAIVLQGNRTVLLTHWCALTLGCAWVGLLAAGVFRATAAGVAAVLFVPVVITPLVRQALVVPSARSMAGFPDRVRELAWFWLPQQADALVFGGLRMAAQPVGAALALSLTVLVCVFVFVGLRRRTHW
ncbi:ATP-binding cassette domain-containing protein [Streptomyces sp. NPDC005963]|uniref:ATP-binding cassette domain-containing protein n=1 Tax=Streptomyces sp. NPDC005963 TaxID=3156721 RepID=UPI0033E7B0FD